MKKAVGVILANNEQKFLMHLRDDKPTIVYPAYWSFLGGGIESGESPEQALRREIKEEIDFDLGDISHLGNFSDPFDNFIYMYKSGIDKKLEELTLTEGQRLGYFSFKELIRLRIPPPLRDFLNRYRSKII